MLAAAPRTAADDAPARLQGAIRVVMNPASGDHDAGATRRLIEETLRTGERPVHMVAVATPKDLPAASLQAADAAAREGGVLVAVGGDGTLNAVAQAAWHHDCVMGIVPQGTFNYFGREHGVPQDAQAAARALLRAQVRPVQVGLVNGRLFLVNASLGLYPQLLQDRESFKQKLGRHRWVALAAGLVTVIQWRRQLTLEMQGERGQALVRTPTLFVGNNHLQFAQLGLDESVPDAGRGHLGGVLVKPIGTPALLALALRGALGWLGEADQVRAFPIRRLVVQVRGRRRVKLAVDGEVGLVAPPLCFEVAPRPLQLLVPRPEDRAPIE